MIVKNNIVPINIKNRDKKIWKRGSSYTANAYIFSSRNECLESLKETICCSKKEFKDSKVFIVIMLDSEDPSIYIESRFAKIDIKNGALIVVDICDIDLIVPYFYRYWGNSRRFQLFFSYNNEMTLTEQLMNICKKYLNSFDSYYSIIKKCELVLSDSGDGDELELIYANKYDEIVRRGCKTG